jgi:hypothetical protein
VRAVTLVAVKRHLIFGFEGLLRHVMYVFDDAVVFVDPPSSIRAADAVRIGIAKSKAVHAPTFKGEDAIEKLAREYVKRRKFTDIRAFSRQFGDAGFSDPRITSAMLAEQLERTARVPLSDISGVRFEFHRLAPEPYVAVRFARSHAVSPTDFYMRYGMPKVREAHQVLSAVLGPRVASLTPQ